MGFVGFMIKRILNSVMEAKEGLECWHDSQLNELQYVQRNAPLSPANMMAAIQCIAVHQIPPICPFRPCMLFKSGACMLFIATGTSYYSVPVAEVATVGPNN